MTNDELLGTIREHLANTKNDLTVSIKTETKGIRVFLCTPDGIYQVSKFYNTDLASTVSPQLLRVQTTHLVQSLMQKILDTVVGKDVFNV